MRTSSSRGACSVPLSLMSCGGSVGGMRRHASHGHRRASSVWCRRISAGMHRQGSPCASSMSVCVTMTHRQHRLCRPRRGSSAPGSSRWAHSCASGSTAVCCAAWDGSHRPTGILPRQMLPRPPPGTLSLPFHSLLLCRRFLLPPSPRLVPFLRSFLRLLRGRLPFIKGHPAFQSSRFARQGRREQKKRENVGS